MSLPRRLLARLRGTARIDALEARLGALDGRVAAELGAAPQARLGALDAQLAAVERGLGPLAAQLAALEGRLAERERLQQVRDTMDWIERAALARSPLISVVLPTRDRAPWLARAIASVEAQSYPDWELLVVDDDSRDDTAALLARAAGPRLHALRGAGRGACAARNVALAAAAGSIVAYLDDDNLMHPHWLKAVAWAFTTRPAADVLYGAFLVDDPERILGGPGGALPRLYFFPYDHSAVARDNIADMGCIAHRAGLPGTRFDEGLREMGDWDLLLRLTRDKAPFALPAIACYYTTDAPHRLSNGPTFATDLALVRERHRR
ncbi:MAG: glycosyltransferase [Dongiaceae bacterium]